MSTLYACPELTSGPTPSVLIYVADGASYSMFGNGDKQYEITEHFNKGDKFYLSYEDDYDSCYKTYNPFPDGDYSRSWLLSGMDASNVNLYENGAGYFEISQSSDYHITVNLLTNKMTVNKVSSTVVVGDVNNDGSCTSSDVTAIYNYILYNDNSAIVNGDQNDDGEITASDVTAIYNVILGN